MSSTSVDLAVIVPTRQRPERFRQMADAIEVHSVLNTVVVACVDDDDPALQYYRAQVSALPHVQLMEGPRKTLAGWTNYVAARMLLDDSERPAPRYFASLGDDHVVRTPGWDRRLTHAIEALGGELGGWAWGPDGRRADMLPTWWVVSAPVVERLGWVMLAECEHMYVDNAVRDIAYASERAAVCPDVLVEHIHPVEPKYRHLWDASYAQSNRSEQYERDRQAYERWRDAGGLADDVDKLRAEPIGETA